MAEGQETSQRFVMVGGVVNTSWTDTAVFADPTGAATLAGDPANTHTMTSATTRRTRLIRPTLPSHENRP